MSRDGLEQWQREEEQREMSDEGQGAGLNAEQPPPADGEGPDCWLLVLADMEERRRLGIERYGKPVRPDNGRDALIEAYQECLDLAVYLRQAIAQRDAK